METIRWGIQGYDDEGQIKTQRGPLSFFVGYALIGRCYIVKMSLPEKLKER